MPELPISSSFVTEWAKAQPGTEDKDLFDFLLKLEEELDLSRAQHSCAMLHNQDTPIDFSSCDVLRIGESGALMAAFLQKLARNPSFQLGAHRTRLLNGNSKYLETIENEVAELHGAETGLIVTSSAVANDAIFLRSHFQEMPSCMTSSFTPVLSMVSSTVWLFARNRSVTTM